MADGKHTPGPWVSDFNRDTGVEGVALTFAIHGGEKSYITSGQSAEHLKTDGQCDDPIMAAECEANARLIAAAPDLLDALTECLDELEYLSKASDSDYARPGESTITQTRAAIAKATGSAS